MARLPTRHEAATLAALIGWVLAVLLAAAPDEPPRPPTPALELAWDAPAECPDAERVRAAIVRLLGRPLGEDPRRTVRVEGTIALRDGQWVLDLRVGDGEESIARTFSATSCGELLEPAAVVCALAIDEPRDAPTVPEVPAEPAPRAASAATPPSVAPHVPAPLSDPPRRARPRRSLAAVLGARGGIDGGNLPGVGGALEAAVGLAIDRARVELVGLHLFERSAAAGFGARAHFRVFAVRPQGCWAPMLRRAAFPLCGGVELGVLRARAERVVAPEPRRHLWLALVAGAGVRFWPVPRFGLGLHADLVVVPFRRDFQVGRQSFFVTRNVGGRGLVALELRLP